MTATIERGRWYPSPAPALDGEDDGGYTNRLTGADRSGRYPYDHQRNRQCSIGWHMECSGWRVPSVCECPCHTDQAPYGAESLPGFLSVAAEKLAGLYSLPVRTTGMRVMAMAYDAAQPSGFARPDQGELEGDLASWYGHGQSDAFVTDVVNVYQAAAAGTLA